MKWGRRRAWVYWLLAACAGIAGAALSYTRLAAQFDNNTYDFLFRRNLPEKSAPEQSVVLAIDEETLLAQGGMRNVRRILANAVRIATQAGAKVIAVDLVLADGGDPRENAALAQAFEQASNLVLACEMMPDGARWQDPLEIFRTRAQAVGHVGALADEQDAVVRQVPLERVADRQQRWALALEAFRLARAAPAVEASPIDLNVGGTLVPSRWDQGRPLRVRFHRTTSRVPLAVLLADPTRQTALKDKVVFIGVDAISAARDRYFTPLSASLPQAGVAIHAQLFDTLAGGRFLVDAPLSLALLISVIAALICALLFTLYQGWRAYWGAVLLLLAIHWLPQAFFARDVVLPTAGPIATIWLAVLGCASWQYFFVRRLLAQSEFDRSRYQQTIHWVTHEMRTPLTAIQGSSELITRYNLQDSKRKEIGELINSESKRLSRMITTFLEIERIGAGQIELRKTNLDLSTLVNICVARARLLAQRKQIEIEVEEIGATQVQGDQELLEYAVYNLLTNAIKYSPENTRVKVQAAHRGGEVRLAVADQGYGIEEKDLKNIFKKFYRTESAVASKETGSGIGLSIVEQIVTHHGGRMQVTSKRGEGSCFTIILPVSSNGNG